MFRKTRSKLQIQLAPKYIQSISLGIHDYLNTLVLKYITDLKGTMISFNNISITHSKSIMTESPFILVSILVDFIIFSPKVEDVLCGIVNKVSPDHIGLILYGFFNVSISKDQFKYTWDDESHTWKHKHKIIKPGSVLVFRVLKVITGNDLMTMYGTLGKDCGLVKKELELPEMAIIQVEHEIAVQVEQVEEESEDEVNPRKIIFQGIFC
jgi:DNA-directed RNA polymerase subunit E'/Rpb7